MPSRKLTFEKLSSREMLTGNLDVTPDPTVFESFHLRPESPDDQVLISNESDSMAYFNMQFNGNFSVNTKDLVEQIREFEVPGEPDMPDYEKAYHYMLKFHAHDWAVSDKFYIHEPSLYVNSFGVGLCGDSAGVLKLIWNGMGYESRLWYINGHVVSEVFTGERWQMYDADLRVVYYRHDTGQVAGVEELAANPQFIYDPLVRFDNPNGSGVNHSHRTASFYSTTDNNWICYRCTEHVEERDLVFQIPAGGNLRFGQLTPERRIPIANTDVDNLGLLTVTVPRNSSGTLDIPLALYDVTGSRSDSVTIGSQVLALGTDEVFDYSNRETGRFEQAGQRLDAISFDGNSEPFEVHYLVNKKITEVLEENLVEIQHVGEVAELSVEFVNTPNAVRWRDVHTVDINGDGLDDIAGWMAGRWTVQRSSSDFFHREVETENSFVNYEFVGTADFNGDGASDIARRSSDGTLWVSLSHGNAPAKLEPWGRLTTITDWELLVGDFDGDGLDDVLGRAERDGTFWLAKSTGSQFSSSHWVGSPPTSSGPTSLLAIGTAMA